MAEPFLAAFTLEHPQVVNGTAGDWFAALDASFEVAACWQEGLLPVPPADSLWVHAMRGVGEELKPRLIQFVFSDPAGPCRDSGIFRKGWQLEPATAMST